MANISTWAAAGLHAIQVGAINSTGLFTGFGELTVANTTQHSGMHRLYGSVSAPSPISDVTRVTQRGDDAYGKTFLFNSPPNEYTVGLEAKDLDAECFFGNKAIVSLGEWDTIVRGNSNRSFQNVVSLFAREAQSMEAGGVSGYENLLVFNSELAGKPADAAFQAIMSMAYAMTANRTTVFPWGVLIDTDYVDTDGITLETFSTYPLTLECFISDGIITAVPLTYTPSTAARTKAWNATTGTALTVSSVNTSGKTATLSAAPVTAQVIVVLYETPDI